MSCVSSLQHLEKEVVVLRRRLGISGGGGGDSGSDDNDSSGGGAARRFGTRGSRHPGDRAEPDGAALLCEAAGPSTEQLADLSGQLARAVGELAASQEDARATAQRAQRAGKLHSDLKLK